MELQIQLIILLILFFTSTSTSISISTSTSTSTSISTSISTFISTIKNQRNKHKHKHKHKNKESQVCQLFWDYELFSPIGNIRDVIMSDDNASGSIEDSIYFKYIKIGQLFKKEVINNQPQTKFIYNHKSYKFTKCTIQADQYSKCQYNQQCMHLYSAKQYQDLFKNQFRSKRLKRNTKQQQYKNAIQSLIDSDLTNKNLLILDLQLKVDLQEQKCYLNVLCENESKNLITFYNYQQKRHKIDCIEAFQLIFENKSNKIYHLEDNLYAFNPHSNMDYYNIYFDNPEILQYVFDNEQNKKLYPDFFRTQDESSSFQVSANHQKYKEQEIDSIKQIVFGIVHCLV